MARFIDEYTKALAEVMEDPAEKAKRSAATAAGVVQVGASQRANILKRAVRLADKRNPTAEVDVPGLLSIGLGEMAPVLEVNSPEAGDEATEEAGDEATE